jgi:prophage antirepressor-like protein
MAGNNGILEVLKEDNFMDDGVKIYGTLQNPLFVANDIAKLLDIKNIISTMSEFSENHKVLAKIQTKGGKQEVNMLTEFGLYKLIFISRKPQALQFQEWVFNVLQQIRLNGYYIRDEFKEKLAKKEQEVQDLQKKLEQRKHTTEKSGVVYIAGNAKEKHRNIYKVGETINESKRVSSMNTCESDNCFMIYKSFQTKDRKLAEKLIHTYLESNNLKYEKEFFSAELSKLIDIVYCFTTFVNQIVSDDDNHSINEVTKKLLSNMTVTTEDLKEIIKEELKEVSHPPTPMPQNITNNNDQSTTNNNTTINITINTKDLKFFDPETYKTFIEEHLRLDDTSKAITQTLINAFVKYTESKEIKPKKYIKGGGAQSYYFAKDFKDEFVKVLEETLDRSQIKLKFLENGKEKCAPRGFHGVKMLHTEKEETPL